MLKITEARLKRGWSMNELSRRSDVPVSSISSFESGLSLPSLCSFCKICRAMDIPLDNEILDTSKCICIDFNTPKR